MAVGAFEKKRVEELFKYFQATSHAIGLADNDVDSEHQYDPTLGRVSLDPVLNALCQLGVHRLDCDRAFISLIDHENQWIISEMTKSVSLYDTSRHDAGDAICMGARPLDLYAGVCAGTMPAFTGGPAPNSHHLNTTNIFADETRYVINDFSLEPHYKDRPYVRGHPHMRYYAEVPIKTSHGYIIGTYAVIDNKPRRGLDEQSFLALMDISRSIMRHIEMVKTQDDYAQSSRLLYGLDSLVQDVHSHTTLQSSGAMHRRRSRDETYLPAEPLTSGPRLATMNEPQPVERGSSVVNSNERNMPDKPIVEHVPGGTENQELNEMDNIADLKDLNISADVSTSFGLAAQSLRVAMDLDSVCFLDASTSSTPDATEELRHPGIEAYPNQWAGSMLLGASSKSSWIDGKRSLCTRSLQSTGVTTKGFVTPLPPRMHLSPWVDTVRRCCFHAASSFNSADKDLHLSRQNSPDQVILDQVQNVLPNAASVIFLPLWNAAKREWFASCLGWSSQKKRVFGPDDLAYFNIFGNSLMARAVRLELIATDHAKSDFISNISHELRSPLHGILGSIELLREVVQDADQQQMIAMVEQCGRTLLDTMNHVLDYSKINSIARDNESQSIAETFSPGVEPRSFLENLSTFDLGSLMEEVVESLVAGHHHGTGSQSHTTYVLNDKGYPSLNHVEEGKPRKQSPIVILDIDHRDSWIIESDAGSWRRCVLNLLGNALKYTDAGFVEVVIRSNAPNLQARGVVTLLLRDTGRGIGKDYLENHLFRPFMQEDPLSSGVGLGLSIVKSLVHAMGGRLEVKSEMGIGTQVEVAIPVNFVFTTAEADQMLLTQHSELSACFSGFENVPGHESRESSMSSSTRPRRTLALRRAVTTHLRDWLKININSSTNLDRSMADIVVVEEENLSLFNSDQPGKPSTFQLPARAVLLVLCTQHKIQHHSMYSTSDPVYYVSQPFGPRRLASLMSKIIPLRKSEDFQQTTVMKLPHRPVRGISPSQVTIPVLSDSQTTDPLTPLAEVSVVSPANTSPSMYTPRVLLVDDNYVNLALLVRCMRQLHVNHLTASNGAEALATYKIASPPFDCVFMDISMPIMDGFAATRAIRDFERTAGRTAARIIAMTGLGTAEARQEGLSSGMDMVLIKPVQLKKVRSLIKEMSRVPTALG